MSTNGKPKRASAGQRMIKSARQALSFAEGKGGKTCTVHIPDEIDVERIRRKTGLSQQRFSEEYGFNLRTVQDWEQGRRVPTGPARTFLMVIDREPAAVRRALTLQPA